MGVQKIIYPIGDSHAWHGWLKIEKAAPYSAGPMTMYRFGTDKPNMTKDIPKDAIICFCWGEIDCRCHVYKYQPWSTCIEKLVENYLQAIDVNMQGRDQQKAWIYNVVPPPRNPRGENAAFPFIGSAEERRGFVRRMNELLRESPYTFVDVYKSYADKDGYLNMDMSDGHVHIADEKPLKEWIDAHT